MLEYEPGSCFIAEVGGKPAGHVFSVSYGKLGWIGYVIVDVGHRGRGIGTMLMKKAMDYLLSRRVETIKLEAAPEIADFYRRLGFVEEYDSLRFVGRSRKTVSPRGEHVSRMKAEMLTEVAEFDAKYFGGNRIEVIGKLFKEYPQHCFVSYSGIAVDGYTMCRRAHAGYKLGPWVSNPENPDAAKLLLANCISTLEGGEDVYVGVPYPNKAAAKVLQEFGFEEYSKSIRMRFGKRLETDCVNGIFAMGGPMKG